jgi:hypothetical protein
MKFAARLLLAPVLLILASGPLALAAEYTHAGSGRALRLHLPETFADRPVRGVFLVFKRGAETFALSADETWTGEAVGGSALTGGSWIIYWHKDWTEFMTALGFVVAIKTGMEDEFITGPSSSGAVFIESALQDIAAQASRPELARAPLLLWGHSASSWTAFSFASHAPSRVIGAIAFHSHRRDYLYHDTGLATVPGLRLSSALETDQPPDLHESFLLMRAAGSPVATGVEPGLPHGGGNGGRNFLRPTIIFPWVLSVVGQRLPDVPLPYVSPPVLRPLSPGALRLGHSGAPAGSSGVWQSNGTFTYAAPSAYDASPPAQASVLPDAAFAQVWRTYFASVPFNTGNTAAAALRTVLVQPVVASTSEGSAAPARVAFVRSGDLSGPLTVRYALSGAATPGADYATPSGELVIPAGARSAELALTALADAAVEGNETVVLTVEPDPAYLRHEPTAVTLTITDATPAPAGIAAWRVLHFGASENVGPAADTADPDGDGVSNLLEYALATDPLAPSAQPPLQATLTPSLPHSLRLTFLRARPELTYEVQSSSDLVAWQTLATNPGGVSLTEPVTVADSVPVSTAPRRFLRLRVH